MSLGFLCATSAFSVSLWLFLSQPILTTETQRKQRLHREELIPTDGLLHVHG